MQEEKQAVSEKGELLAAAILSLRVAALVCLAALCWHLTGHHAVLTVVAWVLLLAVSAYALAGAVLLAAMLRNILGRRSFFPDRDWALQLLGLVILLGVLAVFVAEFAFLVGAVR